MIYLSYFKKYSVEMGLDLSMKYKNNKFDQMKYIINVFYCKFLNLLGGCKYKMYST